MSYYMTGTDGFGQDMVGSHFRGGIAIPKRPGTVYRSMHGFGGARPNPLWLYSGGAGPYMGYGAAPSSSSVCADWMAGGSADSPDQAAGTRATQAIQAQLNNQGYGPIAVDGIWGPATQSAWDAFAQKTGAAGWPDCTSIDTLMSGGGKGDGSSKASMGLGLGLLALVAVGAAALLAKKKHAAGAPHKAPSKRPSSIVIRER